MGLRVRARSDVTRGCGKSFRGVKWEATIRSLRKMSRYVVPPFGFAQGQASSNTATSGASSSVAQSAETSKPKQPVATVDGQPIYDEDLAPSVEGQLQPLRNQEYEIKKKALDNLIEQKMLEAAAKKKGLTTEKLLDQEVNSKVPDPSDAL